MCNMVSKCATFMQIYWLGHCIEVLFISLVFRVCFPKFLSFLLIVVAILFSKMADYVYMIFDVHYAKLETMLHIVQHGFQLRYLFSSLKNFIFISLFSMNMPNIPLIFLSCHTFTTVRSFLDVLFRLRMYFR